MKKKTTRLIEIKRMEGNENFGEIAEKERENERDKKGEEVVGGGINKRGDK